MAIDYTVDYGRNRGVKTVDASAVRIEAPTNDRKPNKCCVQIKQTVSFTQKSTYRHGFGRGVTHNGADATASDVTSIGDH